MTFTRVDEFITSAVHEKEIPGAVLAIANSNELLHCKAFGMAHVEKQIKMTEQTLFDCASLTKVVATATSVFTLLEQGLIDLDDSISYYYPQFIRFHEVVHFLSYNERFHLIHRKKSGIDLLPAFLSISC